MGVRKKEIERERQLASREGKVRENIRRTKESVRGIEHARNVCLNWTALRLFCCGHPPDGGVSWDMKLKIRLLSGHRQTVRICGAVVPQNFTLLG